LDLGGFEMGVDLLVDGDQLPGRLKVVDTVAKRRIAHAIDARGKRGFSSRPGVLVPLEG